MILLGNRTQSPACFIHIRESKTTIRFQEANCAWNKLSDIPKFIVKIRRKLLLSDRVNLEWSSRLNIRFTVVSPIQWLLKSCSYKV